MERHNELKDSIKNFGWSIIHNINDSNFKLVYDRFDDPTFPIPAITYNFLEDTLFMNRDNIQEIYAAILKNNKYDDNYNVLLDDNIKEDVINEFICRRYICDNFLLNLIRYYSLLCGFHDDSNFISNEFIRKIDYYAISDMLSKNCYYLRIIKTDKQYISFKVNIEGFKNFTEFYKLLKLKAYFVNEIKDGNINVSEYHIPIVKLQDWFNTLKIYKK